MFNYYLVQAARNKGWSVEFLESKRPYLLKFTKEDKFFYSNKFLNIDVNFQSSTFSKDKSITSKILNLHNFNNINTKKLILNNKEELMNTYNKFSNFGKEIVVVKPLNGFGGEGIKFFYNLNEFLIGVSDLKEEYCISTYFKHVAEVRIIIFRGKNLFLHLKSIMRNKNGVLVKLDRSDINLSYSFLKKLNNIAIGVSNVFNYNFIAVDFLVDENDNYSIIEVNLNPNLLPYSDRSEFKLNKVIKAYEKIFDFKEKLMDFSKRD